MSEDRKQQLLQEWRLKFDPEQKSTAPQTAKIDYVDEDVMIVTEVRDWVGRQTLRMQSNTIGISFAGRLTATFHGEALNIERGDMFIFPSGMVCSDVMVSPDFEFTLILLSDRILQSFLRANMEIWNKLVYVERRLKLRLTETEIKYQQLYKSLIWIAFDNSGDLPTGYHKELIHSLLRSVVIAVCLGLTVHRERETGIRSPVSKPQLARRPAVPSSAQSLSGGGRSAALFSQFLEMLQKAPNKHITVKDIATRMCITPKYLTVLCLKHSGKTASDWIEEYTIAEIVYYLRSSDLSIKEISERIGFTSPSFFGKYVRERLGMSPQRYRAKVHRRDADAAGDLIDHPVG